MPDMHDELVLLERVRFRVVDLAVGVAVETTEMPAAQIVRGQQVMRAGGLGRTRRGRSRHGGQTKGSEEGDQTNRACFHECLSLQLYPCEADALAVPEDDLC